MKIIKTLAGTMTFKWNDPEIKSLLFAYALFGMLVLGPPAWRIMEPVCILATNEAGLLLSSSSFASSEPPLWDRLLEVAIAAGIGGLLGFAFVVSVLFTLLYLPERVWVWSKIYIF